jgi:hydroxymethylglutaryl-CoA lyase
MKDRVTIVEVSPRDGLPALCGGTSTADKIAYINSLAQAGLKKIECVAFTHPRLIPENADAEAVLEGIKKKHGVSYIGLVPNEIGCRRALVTKIDTALTLVAVTDIFTKLNAGRSLREHVNKTLPAIFDATLKAGKSVRSYILTAFGCPYSGKVSYDDVLQLVMKMKYMGASEIVLADSTGMANPRQVKELLTLCFGLKLDVNLAVHFHNTRGTAIANCMAAYESGVRTFDTSVGGMSGTPYGAIELAFGYWNVPTEDLVHLFEEMGVKTGVDMDSLLECVKIAERLADKPLPGHILRASVSSRLAEVPERLTKITKLGVW